MHVEQRHKPNICSNLANVRWAVNHPLSAQLLLSGLKVRGDISQQWRIRPGQDGYLVDTRRLTLLLALARLGSMRRVAETFTLTTSTVSQQIAALTRETGKQFDRAGWPTGASHADRS
jgi:hypothetical protein